MLITGVRILVFLSIGAVSLEASDIEGQVRSRSNTLTHATAQLLRDRLPIEDRFISSNGRFEFRNLSPGTYSVKVHADGFIDEEVPVLLDRANAREVVFVELREVTPAPETPADSVSIAEFQIPKSAKREFDQGYEDRKRSQCAKAIPHLQKAIAAYDKYGDAYNELGHCLSTTDAARAEDAFKKAIEYSDTIYPTINLADLYETQKRFEEGRNVLRQSIARHPEEGDLYFGLARLFFDQGLLKEAEAAGLEAHSRLHRAADVHILLAKIYLNINNYPAVETQLRLYLEENPKGPLADQVRKNLADLKK